MRVIVVGLGGVGSMAAWQLAAAGHQVTAIEQFDIDHDFGSSYGDSRIVRRVYPDTRYTALMARAYDLWDDLMAESENLEIFVRCGGLYLGPGSHPDMAVAEAALRESGVEFELLEPYECNRRFPAFRMLRDERALFEPGMGYARASRAVRAAVALAIKNGAIVRAGARVDAFQQAPGSVRAMLATGEALEADRLVIAAGPWTSRLLEPLGIRLPITVTRQPYVHFSVPDGDGRFEAPQFPVWIDAGANAYGFPRLGNVPGVKVGVHNLGPASTPETVDRTVSAEDREAARAYARRRFPAISGATVYEKVCLYSVTPDNNFVIDRVPGFPEAILISACSGHGFKFTPLLGRITVELVQADHGRTDLSAFRATRFTGNN